MAKREGEPTNTCARSGKGQEVSLRASQQRSSGSDFLKKKKRTEKRGTDQLQPKKLWKKGKEKNNRRGVRCLVQL